MPIPAFKGKKTKKRCQKYVSKVIKTEYERGHPLNQSQAIAYSVARKKGCKF